MSCVLEIYIQVIYSFNAEIYLCQTYMLKVHVIISLYLECCFTDLVDACTCGILIPEWQMLLTEKPAGRQADRQQQTPVFGTLAAPGITPSVAQT